MRRAVRVAAVTGLLSVLVALPALAHHSDQDDPRDTQGRLDVRDLAFDHHPDLRWTFTTYRSWTIAQLWDHGTFVVQLDTKGDDEPDYLVVVRSDGHDVVAELYRVRPDRSQVHLGALEAGKSSGRVAWVKVALDQITIGKSRSAYYWSVITTFTSDTCPRTCLDRVPDEGQVEQLLVSPTPTPTPTPSPTPSPTATPR